MLRQLFLSTRRVRTLHPNFSPVRFVSNSQGKQYEALIRDAIEEFQLYVKLEKWQEALVSARLIEEKSKELMGIVHPSHSSALNNLGYVHKVLGEVEEAEIYYKKAIESYARVYSPKHVNVALAMSNLAALYLSVLQRGVTPENRYMLREAEKAITAALDIRMEAYGRQHSQVASSLVQLSTISSLLGDSKAAIQFIEDAIEIFEKTVGSNNAMTASAYNNYGIILKKEKRFAEAEKYYRKAIQIRTAVLGEKASETIVSWHNLAEMKLAAGDEAGSLEIRSRLEKDIQKIVTFNKDWGTSPLIRPSAASEALKNISSAPPVSKFAHLTEEELQVKLSTDSQFVMEYTAEMRSLKEQKALAASRRSKEEEEERASEEKMRQEIAELQKKAAVEPLK